MSKTKQEITVHVSSLPSNAERRKALPEFLQLAQAIAGVIFWERSIRDSGDSLRWYGDNTVLYGKVVHNIDEWLEIIHPDDRPRVEALIRKSIVNEDEFDTEYRVIWPDGSAHWIYGRGKVLYGSDGKPVRMIGANMNVTRHKQAEKETHEIEKTALLGRMLSAVMHEINNPLQSVNDILYLLEQNPRLDSESRGIVASAVDQLDRARQVADNTLTLSRSDLILQPVNLRGVVDDVLTSLRERIEGDHIRVDRQYRPVERIPGSEPHLRQVFINLIRNAIEAAGKGGKLLIRIGKYRGSGVKVLVCDSGRGLDSETRKRIGEPFFSRKQSGTGLGLWVSSEILRKHGGRLQARNLLGGRGACFVVTLPGPR